MAGYPVVFVDAGGLPVTYGSDGNGWPIEEALSGLPVTIVAAGGLPVSEGVGVWGNYGRGPNNGFGTPLMDWSNFGSLQNSAGTAELVTGSPLGAGKALKLTHNATPSFGQVQLSPFYDLPPAADILGYGVKTYNASTKALGVRFDFYNSTAAKIYTNRIVIDPGAQFPIFSQLNTSVSGGAWSGGALGGDSIRFYRVTQDNPTGTPVWGSGDVVYVGEAWKDPRARPKFMLTTDDGFSDTATFVSIAESFGFKVTIYIVPPLVGTPGYLTWPQLEALRDAGHCIASHSWSHPVDTDSPATTFKGLTRLGPQGFANVPTVPGSTNDDTAIYNDIALAVTDMRARGFPDAVHPALPQGAFDESVRTAIVRLVQAGLIKSVRGVSGTGLYGFTVPVGNNAHGTQNAAVPLQSGFITIGGSVQIDGAATEAQILTNIRETKRQGASGSCYAHTSANSAFSKWTAACTELYDAWVVPDAGDVVTVAQWYDGLRAPAQP